MSNAFTDTSLRTRDVRSHSIRDGPFEEQPEQASNLRRAIKRRMYTGKLRFEDGFVPAAGEAFVVEGSTNGIQDDDNSSAEALRQSAIVSQDVARRAGNLRFDNGHGYTVEERKVRSNKDAQKRTIKKRYYYRHNDGNIFEKPVSADNKRKGIAEKIKDKVKELFENNKVTIAVFAVLSGFIVLLVCGISMCGAMMSQPGGTITESTFLATDEEILAAESAYLDKESALQTQVDNIESSYPGYDEYRYQIDEISHDPYALISYLTVVYGDFKASDVKSDIDKLFADQYTLNVWEKKETRIRIKEDGTTEEYEYKILNVQLTNKDLETVTLGLLDEEQMAHFRIYLATMGNRSNLFGERHGGGLSYDFPPEALSDERFARMIREAEKYLGYPYVFGGSSPKTSFDCSGFVSWVINHCGNGWNVGRLGASGLMRICTKISPAEAKPGDLIFFEKTYKCKGPASHVGIYVGDGMMIHCGKPIQYTSIKKKYWQNHFLCFGRLP